MSSKNPIQKKYNLRNNKNKKLKKAKQDSDTDDIESSSENETTDSSYKPRKKITISSDNESSSDESSSDDSSSNESLDNDESSSNDSSDDESSDKSSSKPVSKSAFQKMLATMFPSKYMDEKVNATNKKDKQSEKQSKPVSSKKLLSFMKKVSKDGKYQSSSSSNETDTDESSHDEVRKKKTSKHNKKKSSEKQEDDDDEEEDEDNLNNINIIFSGFEGEYGDEKDMDILEEDENAECNSEDEETFMKETYEKIEIVECTKKDTLPKSKLKDKKSKKSVEKKEEDDETELDAENEYSDLIELKKHLRDKLQTKPNSKMLKQAIKDCKESISKLVMKGRSKNARKYFDLIHGEQKNTSELEYFKKKMSNKEQLKIMQELTEINTYINIDKPYRLSLLQSNIPPKYKATVMQKLNILRQMEPGDPEYYKIKNWVDTFMRVPFGKYKELSVKMSDGIDVCSKFMCDAKARLDDCVYGLNDAKLQILQMVGQWITNPKALGTAIAIKGPPGTGKSSLVKEGISQILGREFAFIALGGSGDSSYLEGHSYTYEGSSWGKIVQFLIDSKCMNPIIYFDELDKISETPRGEEITGILTHLTDTTQNNQFHDKYFADIDFDVSKCLFIFSYNDESKVNPILRDRMYRIQTKGYSAKEKVIIARKHLLPKIREQVSFLETDVIIPDETLTYIITNKALTQDEAGVRNLKRCLEIIHTKLNLFRLVHQETDIFRKEIELTVSFPMTVSCKDVDALIKNDENQNQSMLSMYV